MTLRNDWAHHKESLPRLETAANLQRLWQGGNSLGKDKMNSHRVLRTCLGALVLSLGWGSLRADEPDKFVRLRKLDARSAVFAVAFSKDGAIVAAQCNNDGDVGPRQIVLWDVATGRRVRRLRPAASEVFSAVPFARLCAWTQEGLDIQNDLNESQRHSRRLRDLDSSSAMGRVFFSSDDKFVAGVRKDNKTLIVWDLSTGSRLAQCQLPDVDLAMLRDAAFDRSGEYLAVGYDVFHEGGEGIVLVFHVPTGRKILESSKQFRVFDVAFTSRGDLLVAGGTSIFLEKGYISIKSGADFSKSRTIEVAGAVTAVVPQPDSLVVTSGYTGEVAVRTMATGKPVTSISRTAGKVWAMALSTENLAFGFANEVEVWKRSDETP